MRKAVAPTVERILELAADVGLTEARQHDFSVALSEALSNAAVHGNQLHPTRAVAVRIEIEPGRSVVVDIEDSGNGFDFAAISDPTGDDSQILKPSGRGLFLMRRLVDRLDFNEEGNHVRLTMKRRS